MPNFTAKDVMALREATGAGMMDCKKSLVETDGDTKKAMEILREKGLAAAAKRADRVAAEGVVGSYIHMGGKIGVLLEVNCETDFVALTDGFKDFVKDIAMHIAASNPQYVSMSDVPKDIVEKEKEFLTTQAMNEGKPQNIAEKMVEGRIKKFFKKICLMEQEFVKDTDKTVAQVQTDLIAKLGENISIRRFTRYMMGEGIQKKEENFAEEVKSQMN